MIKIYIDTETSDLNPYEDKILEIAGVKTFHDRVVGVFDEYIYHPNTTIAPGAYEVHGLTQYKIKYLANHTITEVEDRFNQFIQDADTLTFCNAHFDIGFLRNFGNKTLSDTIDTKEVEDLYIKYARILSRRLTVNQSLRLVSSTLNECISLLLNNKVSLKEVEELYKEHKTPKIENTFHDALYDSLCSYKLDKVLRGVNNT